jgi:hypothetical protein
MQHYSFMYTYKIILVRLERRFVNRRHIATPLLILHNNVAVEQSSLNNLRVIP